MSELQYPFVNVPPIVYNQPLATMEVLNAIEAYERIRPNDVYNASTKPLDTPISFVPVNGKGELGAVRGIALHPQSHVLTNNSFTSSNRPNKSRKMKLSKCDFPKQHKYDENKQNTEIAKYYVAGLGVVGLVILYRFISRSEY